MSSYINSDGMELAWWSVSLEVSLSYTLLLQNAQLIFHLALENLCVGSDYWEKAAYGGEKGDTVLCLSQICQAHFIFDGVI